MNFILLIFSTVAVLLLFSTETTPFAIGLALFLPSVVLFIRSWRTGTWKPVAFIAVASTPFVSLEVFRLVGKSVTLPYLCWLPAVVWGWGLIAAGRRPLRFSMVDKTLWAWLSFSLVGALIRWHGFPFDSFGLKTFTQAGYMIFCWTGMKGFEVFIAEDRDDRLRFVSSCFALTALAVTLHGAIQIAAWHGFGTVLDFGRNANVFANQRGLLSIWAGGLFRACSFFPEPVFMAAFLSCALCFKIKAAGPFLSRLGKCASALIAVGMAITLSRTAFLALAAAGMAAMAALAAARFEQQRGILLVLVVVFLAFSSFALFFFPETFDAPLDGDISVVWRAVEARDALSTAARFPWLGLGLGNYDTLGSRYSFMGPFSRYVKPFTSSLYTKVLLETGLIGSFFFGIFCISLIQSAWQFDKGYKAPNLVNTLLPRDDATCQRCDLHADISTCFGKTGAMAATLIMWCGHSAFNMTFLWIFFATILGSEEIS